MGWKDKKEELEKLILTEKKSYEEIGRIYGCTGSNIKKVALHLGIKLHPRRVKNPKETFGTGIRKTKRPICICKYCGKEFIKYDNSKGYFCSCRCQHEYQYNENINKWKSGEIDGVSNGYSVASFIRRYLFEKYNNSCQMCGWDEVNPYSGKVPLQIHHIDGDCTNNKEENLQLLCPNCHSLTENYGSRNKSATKGRNQYFTKKAREEYSKRLHKEIETIRNCSMEELEKYKHLLT